MFIFICALQSQSKREENTWIYKGVVALGVFTLHVPRCRNICSMFLLRKTMDCQSNQDRLLDLMTMFCKQVPKLNWYTWFDDWDVAMLMLHNRTCCNRVQVSRSHGEPKLVLLKVFESRLKKVSLSPKKRFATSQSLTCFLCLFQLICVQNVSFSEDCTKKRLVSWDTELSQHRPQQDSGTGSRM